MAESPTGSTAANTALQSPAFESPIKEPSELSSTTRQASPKSPKQSTLCQKRAGRRHKPYPDRSPGGSTCSSDDSNGESDDSDLVKQTEQRRVKRLAANTRERKRMHTVNSAFEQLRDLVPTYPTNRKLSKIDTLRLACTYIQDLVSLLHNTHQLQPADDCIYHPALPDGYIPNAYTGVGVKTEMPEYSSFTQYRMPPSDCTSSDTFSASESDNSPPYFAAHSQACSPGIAVRPPPLTRTSSDSAAIYARMAQEQTVNTGSVCQTQRQMNIPSPLATCTYTHTAQTQLSMTSTPVLSNGLTHQPPPAWSRTGSVPTGYTVYRQ